MISRIIEAHYARHAEVPEAAMLDFWLQEARRPQILVDIALVAPQRCQALIASRPLLTHAATGDEALLAKALRAEEDAEREADRRYWAPLKQELEKLRFSRTRPTTGRRDVPHASTAPRAATSQQAAGQRCIV